MLQPEPGEGAPAWTVELLDGNLHLSDACLRLYGHPGLLAVAASILGDDFVPYNEVTFVKEAGLGPSVAWHQDGTTHWDSPTGKGAHGFNFMTQLYPSTAANGVWVLPGSHRLGKADIKKLVPRAARTGSRARCRCCAPPATRSSPTASCCTAPSPTARPTGTSPSTRLLPAGGLGVTTRRLTGTVETYDLARIEARTRILQLAIDARRQRFPQETSYVYRPLAGREDETGGTRSSRHRAEELQPARHVHLSGHPSELAHDVALHGRPDQPGRARARGPARPPAAP